MTSDLLVRLQDPQRLRALRATGILDAPGGEALDRLTRLAARVLDAPLAAVALLDDEQQVYVSAFGFPREELPVPPVPLDRSICRHVVAAGEPLRVPDLREWPFAPDGAPARELGMVAYAGAPLFTPDGYVLGTLCVLDARPRCWTPGEMETLQELASAVAEEVEWRRREAEHRETEAALRASEELFGRLAATVRDVVYVNGADGVSVLYVSPAYEEVWGRSRESLYRDPRSWKYSIHPDDRARVEEGIRGPDGELRAYDLEYRIVRPDGEVRWIRDRLFPIRDEEGKLLRDAGIAEDITERKRGEQALRESMVRYRQLFERNNAIKLLIDPGTGEIVDANPAAAEFYGYSLERLREMRVMDLNLHPPERVMRDLAQAVREERSFFSFPHRLASGEVRHVEVHSSPLELQGRKLIFSILHDVTARVRAEEERAEAVASRNRFYATVSHELRTPLSAIMLYNDLLLSGLYGPLTEAQVEGIQRSQHSAGHLLELVNEVLDLSKLEAGRMEVHRDEIALGNFLRGLIAGVRPLAEEHGCELRLVDADAPEVLATDTRRLRQILFNLLSNAVKFGRSRPVVLTCRGDGEGGVVLEVSDQGVGIREEDIPRIFEEFVQLGDGTDPGTGLGLAISRRLAEMLGGRLEVDSVPGVGSTFRLVLPGCVVR